jgi:uncharacterized protein DUF5753
MLKSERHPVWFRDYAGRERHAAELQVYSALVIHGLFQTEAYARHLLLSGEPGIDETEIDARVAARIDRQQILTRKNPPFIYLVMDEGVLHRPIGSPEVMAEQLARLREHAEEPKVKIQVVPTATGAYPAGAS